MSHIANRLQMKFIQSIKLEDLNKIIMQGAFLYGDPLNKKWYDASKRRLSWPEKDWMEGNSMQCNAQRMRVS